LARLEESIALLPNWKEVQHFRSFYTTVRSLARNFFSSLSIIVSVWFLLNLSLHASKDTYLFTYFRLLFSSFPSDYSVYTLHLI
jgi:hypothetical protein